MGVSPSCQHSSVLWESLCLFPYGQSWWGGAVLGASTETGVQIPSLTARDSQIGFVLRC
jgi:hypothetical protein